MPRRLAIGLAGGFAGAVGLWLLAAFAFGAAASPALAAHVTPTLITGTGNRTCSDFQPAGETWTELKQDPPGNGVESDGTLTVAITGFTGKTFNWSANIGVDAVFVKAGSGGSHVYVYSGEATSDTGLSSPGDSGNAISHISFCYDAGGPTSTPTRTPTGTTVANTSTPTTPSGGGGGEDDTPTATRTSTPIAAAATPTNAPLPVSTVLGATPTAPAGVLRLPNTGDGGASGGGAAGAAAMALTVAGLALVAGAIGMRIRQARP